MEKGAYLRKAKRCFAIHNKKLFVSIAALLILLLSIVVLSILMSKPLESLAERRASAEAAKLLNDSLREVMDEYAQSGGAEFAYQKSSLGEGSVLFIDAVGMNLMAARVIERAQTKVSELGGCGIEVPLGSASGLPLLNGAGPRIRVGIEPVGGIKSRFTSAFTGAGVNQTRYRAALDISAEIELLLFGRIRRITASASATICETIVIGGVPTAYTNVESMEDALNLIPTEVEGIFSP